MADLVDLEARLAAMEMILVTHLLQSGVATPGFDPHAFASGRRDAWAAIGHAICTECANDADERRFTQAYAAALDRMGHLLVALAAPVQEAIDEVDELGAGPGEKPA